MPTRTEQRPDPFTPLIIYSRNVIDTFSKDRTPSVRAEYDVLPPNSRIDGSRLGGHLSVQAFRRFSQHITIQREHSSVQRGRPHLNGLGAIILERSRYVRYMVR